MLGRMWFVVLPDCGTAVAAAGVVRPFARDVVEHASGRPWLMGVWPAGHLTLGSAGAARVAVMGGRGPGPGELAVRVGRLGVVEEADRVAAGWAGDFHLLASMGGRVRVRGGAAGARRVFHAELEGVSVASGRADTLAALTGAGVDPDVLALRLAAVPVVYPLEEYCVWRGVRGVRPDDCLLLDSAGRASTGRWWSPPEGVLSFEQGVLAVRGALEGAVSARTAAGGAVSADLSGGMDSTSLCFLAAGGEARLFTAAWQAQDPANEDSYWAQRSALALPDAEHEFVDRDEAPAWYTDPAGVMAAAEEPFGWVHDRVKLLGALERMAARGSRLHLSGGGGDQLFSPSPAHAHELFRIHPVSALRDLRRRQLFQRQALLPLLKALGDRTTFTDDLARSADRLTAGTTSPPPLLGWGPGARMPPWATADASHAVAGALRAAAAKVPGPLSPHRGLHQTLQDLRACADATRRFDQYANDTLGIGYATPYTDDAVIEAALSVRPGERVAALRYKPLLAAAMNNIVPAPVLARRTKGEYTADANTGLRRHRQALLDLFDNSRLADAGLIDPTLLRTALQHPPTTQLHGALAVTLGCEVWLRSLDRAHRPGTPTAASAKEAR
ncbi:asparagine synthase-related protein [Streptomyces anulatus]|uniref:asparagine synthase-related protein n=1 Tax=Streptomyces anulatus TaxID=1892 RepID=UPI00367DAFD4